MIDTRSEPVRLGELFRTRASHGSPYEADNENAASEGGVFYEIRSASTVLSAGKPDQGWSGGNTPKAGKGDSKSRELREALRGKETPETMDDESDRTLPAYKTRLSCCSLISFSREEWMMFSNGLTSRMGCSLPGVVILLAM